MGSHGKGTKYDAIILPLLSLGPSHASGKTSS